MRPLMVLGCTSDAGKSLLSTALCRWFARRGVRVAPFKAQNMSNNARVVGGTPGSGDPGGEIGVAQWLQAEAAGVVPDVRMNPVLLKPEADTSSQVVVRGRVDRELGSRPWDARHDAVWPAMSESFDELRDEFDLVVIEGAGSPAEINLRDQVNNRMIEHADAAALLVSDIDRGGSFAHLYGTWALVPETTRSRLAGFVLNRFRGDPTLLAPGPERLTELTGMASAGVVPMLDHDLPREEGALDIRPIGLDGTSAGSNPSRPTVVLPRLPYGSNLDEFRLLPYVADVHWTMRPVDLDSLRPECDLVVLPGSKHVLADHEWMVRRGLDDAVRRAAERGVRVMGVCGGAMMLGRTFHDPDGREGGRATTEPVAMLGLLDVETVMRGEKRVSSTSVSLDPAWWRAIGVGDPAAGPVPGYEIRFGAVDGDVDVVGRDAAGDPVAWADRRVVATTVHGLFEDPTLVQSVVGPANGIELGAVLDATFDRLADAVEEHLDTELLLRLVDG